MALSDKILIPNHSYYGHRHRFLYSNVGSTAFDL